MTTDTSVPGAAGPQAGPAMRVPTPAQIVGILAVTVFIASEVVAASSITV